MLSCKEVTRIVASGELAEASRGRRIAVRFHHLMCRHCRRYARQIRALGDAARRLWGPGADSDPEALRRLETAILNQRPALGATSPGGRKAGTETSNDPHGA